MENGKQKNNREIGACIVNEKWVEGIKSDKKRQTE